MSRGLIQTLHERPHRDNRLKAPARIQSPGVAEDLLAQLDGSLFVFPMRDRASVWSNFVNSSSICVLQVLGPDVLQGAFLELFETAKTNGIGHNPAPRVAPCT
ncbi:hypothetical protein LuPra_04097 [Luteitalea pratensis]|uniref:Uncharacterized protein n=1 Tax=Luteitalea pratensis TaxID=1855912 RepID=A0A143PSR4_LUTPR|nr:hypothetical protein LuPra_04097 [Luteitalea pratensis]